MAQIEQNEPSDIVEFTLSDIFHSVINRWKLCIILCASFLSIALLYCFIATPLYRAETLFLIERGNVNATRIQSAFNVDTNQNDKNFIATQVKLLSSKTLLKKNL